KDTELKFNRYDWKYHRTVGVKLLDRFKRLHLKHFKPTTVEERLAGELAGIRVEGTADFVGMYKDVFTLVDFKTSGYAYDGYKIHVNPQMYLYAELYRQNYGKLPDQLAYVVFCTGEER